MDQPDNPLLNTQTITKQAAVGSVISHTINNPFMVCKNLVTWLMLLVGLSLTLESYAQPPALIDPSTERFASMLTDVLPKGICVFGIPIFATRAVPDAKLRHAANVMAEYLDNNEDGTPDNMAVVNEMKQNYAMLYMFADEQEMMSLDDTFPDVHSRLVHEFVQDLRGNETLPRGRPHSSAIPEFDATLEETLHLITHAGYASLYPAAFAETTGSEIANAMDRARGGRFEHVPSTYPENAWYTYDDETCDYACQVTEYTYWVITSAFGAQAYSGRREEIANEWDLNTRALLKIRDRAALRIINRNKYALPDKRPNGHYSHKRFTPTSTNYVAYQCIGPS